MRPRSDGMAMIVRVLDFLNRHGKALAIRLTRWTGKHPTGVSPKHLAADDGNHDWYLDLLRPHYRVLDVGCGTGRHSERAATRAGFVVGLDRNAPNSKGRWIRCDLEHGLPVASRNFHVVLMLDVIEHLHRRQEMLAEVRRVLKAGGLLIVTAPNSETTWRQRLRRAGLFAYHDRDHKIEYTKPEFIRELAIGGFIGAQWLPITYDTPWAGLIDVVGGLSLRWYERLTRWRRGMARLHPEESTGFAVVAVRA